MRRRKVGELTVRQEHWDAWENVRIKGLNGPDVAWVKDVAQSLEDKAGGGAMLVLHSGTAQHAWLIRGIVSWTLTDDNGQGLPWPALFDRNGNLDSAALQQREESLTQVMPEDQDFLYQQIQALSNQSSKEEQEAFLAHVSPGLSATQPSVPPPSSTAP